MADNVANGEATTMNGHSESSTNGAVSNESPAAVLARKHAESHPVTIEDVLDEDEIAHPGSKSAIATGTATPVIQDISEKAAGKKPASTHLDVNSQDAFPSLGAGRGPKPVATSAAPKWGAKANGAGSNAASASPASAPRPSPSFASREITDIYRLGPEQQLPKHQFKKPIAETCKDVMKATNTRIEASTSMAGLTTFIIKGEPEAVTKARRMIAGNLSPKQSAKITVPASVRKHIIGAKGATVQGIIQRTNTRIQVPQPDEKEAAVVSDDPFAEDDATIEVLVEGDFEGVQMAKAELQRIVNERTSHLTARLAHIPGQYYPFLAGPHNSAINQLEEGKDLKIRIPPYYTSDSSKVFSPPSGPIVLTGERTAVQDARTELEERVKHIMADFGDLTINISKPQHRFIIGDKGRAINDILADSGCSIILPPAHIPSDAVKVIGPRGLLGNGVTAVMEKANSMHYESIDIARAHKEHFGDDAALQRQHARDVARYLRKKKEMQRLEQELEVQIMLPKTDALYDLAVAGVLFEIFGKDEQKTRQAKQQIVQLVNVHPPQRMTYMEIDPLLHRHIIGAKGRNIQRVKDEHLVEVLFADEDDQDSQVVLVFEGTEPTASAFDQALALAALSQVRELLQKTADEQADLKTKVLPIPAKFHQKILGPKGTTLNSFTGGSDATVRVIVGAPKLKAGQAPLNAALAQAADDSITIRGPSAEVDRVAAKIIDHVEKSKHDEVLNSYSITFEFPQKFQKNLVGKGGSNISKYRDELGVSIDLDGSNVHIKGIKTNVEEAKTRILALANKLGDETVITINVPPEFHRSIIGQGGKYVKRLEDSYGVRINFPKQNREEVVPDNASDAGDKATSARTLATDEILIRGPSKGVKDAKNEITELVKYEQEHGHSTMFTVSAKVIPYIIGASGKAINQIREDTGARIELPPPGSGASDDDQVEIKIRGTKEQVEAAKKAIKLSSSEVEKNVTRTLDIDKKHHRMLIGSGGNKLKALVEDAGGPEDRASQARMIRFPNQDSAESAIRVEGHVDIVDKIVAEIERLVALENDKTTKVVDIAPERHRKLIGREGNTRKNLETTFNVTVDIPKQAKEGQTPAGVKVTGMETDVDKAIERIHELTKDEEGVSVDVPRHLHHSIVDGGSYTRSLRNNHKIFVDFNGNIPPRPARKEPKKTTGRLPLITDAPEDLETAETWEIEEDEPSTEEQGYIQWLLRGSADGIAAGKSDLEKVIARELAQNATGYLVLPDPSKYRYVVGAGGSQVNKIRQDTGCKITIPKENSGGDAIIIRGSKEGVENAKTIIMGLVSGGGDRNGRGGAGGARGGRRPREVGDY